MTMVLSRRLLMRTVSLYISYIIIVAQIQLNAHTLARPARGKRKCVVGKANDQIIVPPDDSVILAGPAQSILDGKKLWLYLNIKQFNFILATPKRQRGRRAQQARATAGALAGCASTAANTINVTAATTATPSATPAQPAGLVDAATVTMSAAASATAFGAVDPIDDLDENPFVESSAHNQSLRFLQESTGVNQLGDHLRTLDFHASESSDSDKDSAARTLSDSEAGTPYQKNRKEAEDVVTFFFIEKGRKVCKFCRYVTYIFCLV